MCKKIILTISVIISMAICRTPIIAFAEISDASIHETENENIENLDDIQDITETENSESSEGAGELVEVTEEPEETENLKDTKVSESNETSEDTEKSEADEKIEDIEDTEESHESSIFVRGFVPTIIVDDDGYLTEENCLCYESSFNAYDELSFSESLSILLDSKNIFYEAEKNALQSLNISGSCPSDLSLDIYYNNEETEVTKINASYTLVDEKLNETKKHVTLYEKDIKQ